MTLYADAYAADVYVLDVPALPLDLPLVDTDGADVGWIETVYASYVDPLGESFPLPAEMVAPDDVPVIQVTWPDPSLFTVNGLGWIYAVVEGGANASQAVDPHPVIVEVRGEWLTIAGTRKLWAEAPEDPRELWLLLASARSACIDFAPEIAAGPLKEDYLQAQLIQARNTWEANRAGGQDTLGSGEYAIPRHPLDWQVRSLLRPRSTAARDVVT